MLFNWKFVVFFAIVAVASAQKKNCEDRACLAVYDPVCANCGGSNRTFGNSCQMGIFNCRHNNICTLVRRGACDQIA